MKNIKIFVLCLTVLVFSPLNVLAMTKEETVFSKLDSYGNVKNIIVNDYLKNVDALENIDDYSDLKDIVNLSGDESFSYNDNKLIWNAQGSNILYQGTSDKDMPISESISYKLDGNFVKINDLIGKSGKVEIIISYSNSEIHKVKINGKNENLYTPFVVTTAMSISNKYNKNVEVTNGKVVDNGNSYVIAALSAPGLYESVKIESLKDINKVSVSFETSKFELPNIYSVISAKVLDSADLDIFSKMDEIYSNVNSLQKNMNSLEESAKVISENIGSVKDNSNLIYNALNDVINGIDSIENGTFSLDEGLKALLENLKNVNNTINCDSEVNKLKRVIVLDKNKIQELSSDGDDNSELISLLNDNIEAVSDILLKLDEISKTINSMIKTVNESVSLLSAGATEVNNGVKSLNNSVTTLTSNYKKLNDGIGELYDGSVKFTSGISKFNKDGIRKIYNAKNEANKVTNKIDKLFELADEYNTFTYSKNYNKNNSTKFIYVVDGIKVKEEKSKIEDVEDKESFWDRIKGLFK